MNKNLLKKAKVQSNEEYAIKAYFDELIRSDFVESYSYEPEPFKLSKAFASLKKHVYTCDFLVIWKRKAYLKFYRHVADRQREYNHLPIAHDCGWALYSYIEVKPVFDFKNMLRLATVNIKWVHAQYDIVVNIIKPFKEAGLLSRTFTPKLVYSNGIISRGSRKGQFRYNFKPVTLKDYLTSLNET